jgi:predicted Zn finger-like uncharacterized protein
MSAMRLNCPACSAVLRTAAEVPAGTRLKCPKCGTTFAPDAEAIPEVLPVATPRRVVAVEDVEDAGMSDRPRPRSRPAQKQPNTALIAGAIVLASLVLVGGAWAVVQFVLLKPKNEPLVFVPAQPVEPFTPPNPVPPGPPVTPQPPDNLSVGKVAPDIEGEDIDGQKFKLSDYRGKVVVLDFWGNW